MTAMFTQFSASPYDIDTAPYYEDNVWLKGLSDQAAQQQNNYQNRGLGAQAAPYIGSATIGQGANMSAATGQSQNANAAGLGPAVNSSGAQGSAAGLGMANDAQSAQIDKAAQNQFRQQQMGLTNQLSEAAQGRGPSLATSQLGQANAAGQAARMSAAASQRGFGNAGATMRQLGYQQGAGNQANAMASAQTRIQEQQAAQQALGNVLSSARGQDIGLASTQAGMEQQTNLANQGAQNQFLLQNNANQQQMELANLANRQQSGMANQSFANQFALQQGEYNQAANLQNAAAANQFGLANMGALNTANANNQNSANQFGLANLQAQNQMGLANIGYLNQASIQNQNAYLQNQKMNDEMVSGMFGNQMNLTQQQLQNMQNYNQLAVNQQIGINQINAQAQANAAKTQGDMVGGLGTAAVGLAMLSDEDEKKDIKKASDKDLESFLTLSPIEEKKNIDPVTRGNIDQFLGDPKFATNLQSQDQVSKQQNLGMLNSFMKGTQGGGLQGLGNGLLSAGMYNQANKGPAAPGPNNYIDTNTMPGFSQQQEIAMSDENEKSSHSMKDKDLSQFIDNVGANKYEYKHPDKLGADDQEHFGPMYQELEKSRIGRSMLTQGPNGEKMVNFGRGVGALMSVTSMLNDRLNRLENKKAK